MFAVLPGMFVILPIYGARINLRLQGGAIAFCAAMLLILLFTSASAAAGSLQQSVLTPAGQVSPPLTVATQSGTARLYVGLVATPRAETFSFLQAGGSSFDVAWSTVRGTEAVVAMADTQPEWTNPVETCPGGVAQCGHLAIAVPVSAPPGRPEAWVLNGETERPIDGTGWHGQHGELNLHGHQYFILLTDVATVPAGAEITLKWPHGWDGRGAAALPAP